MTRQPEVGISPTSVQKEGVRCAKTEPLDSPLNTLNKNITFADEHQDAWWRRTAPLLARILASIGYSVEGQLAGLTFYQQVLLPAMGPHPQQFRSAITRSGLPVEFSVNYQQRGDVAPVVRIGFEPLSGLSGSPQDPYNRVPIRKFVEKLQAIAMPAFNTQLLEHFWIAQTVSAAEQAALQGAKVPSSDLTSQAAFGFDLKPEGIAVKGYTFPALKCQATGQSFDSLITTSIAQVPAAADFSTAFAIVDAYMREVDGYNQFAFFSWDCTEPRESRLKLYGCHTDVTWAKVKDIWTLGGRVQSPTSLRGLDYLQQLWQWMDIREGQRSFTGGFDDGVDKTPTPIVWNYELKPGNPTPLSKFYFPVHGENDRGTVRVVAKFFEHIGLHDQAHTYERTVEEYFPERNLDQTSRLTSWISFAYTEKTGVYLSVYYHSSLDYPWLEEEQKQA